MNTQPIDHFDTDTSNSMMRLMDKIHRVNTFEELKNLIKTDYRKLISHKMAVCGLGDLKTALVVELINVDMPDDYMSTVVMKTPDGLSLNCPVTKKWAKIRETTYIESEGLTTANDAWKAAVQRYSIVNCIVGGVLDVAGNLSSVFYFVNIPEAKRELYLRLVDLTIPALHRAMVNIRRKNNEVERAAYTSNLTGREREILKLISLGLNNDSIAAKLRISVNTVRCHIKNINAKLSVHNRTQALVKAVHRGWVDL